MVRVVVIDVVSVAVVVGAQECVVCVSGPQQN
jgi:hypothetical protein